MNAKNSALVVVLTFLAAVPLLAQQPESPAAAPAAAAPAPQQGATGVAASEPAEPARVFGSLVRIGDDRIELMVEKALGPSAESAGVLVGQTVPFVLDVRTERPAELRVGEGLEVWFREESGLGRALRIVATEEGGEPSASAAAANPPGAAPDAAPPAANPPGDAVGAPQASEGDVTARPPAGSPAPAAVPPETRASSRTTRTASPREVAPVRHTKPLVPPVPETAAAPVAGASTQVLTAPPPPPAAAAPGPAAPEPQLSTDVPAPVGGAGAQANPADAVSRSGNPYRFIGIGVVSMLAALVLLYFTLRGHALDLGLGTGKGGAL